jgi:glycosyltransferase involved in cell wall biosynthesis
MVANIVSRLDRQFDCVGLAPRFESPVPEYVKSWYVPVRKLNVLAFEASPMLARNCDVYWGTNHIIPALARGPKVVTIHDLLLFKYPDDQRWSGYSRRRLISSIKRAGRVVTVSRTTADDLIHMFPGIAGKVEVVRSGFDHPASVCPVKACSEPYVVMLGAHRPRKNLPLAIATVARVRELGHRIRLVVTGEVHACFRPLLRSNDFVYAAGTLPREEMFSLISNARALLFPSMYEGFGFPILESMSANCPVIAMDTPISREIGGTGAFYQPNDAASWSKCLDRLLADECFREQAVSYGRENLSRFSWTAATNAYSEIFQRAR